MFTSQHPAAQPPEPPQISNLRTRLAQAGYPPSKINEIAAETQRRAGLGMQHPGAQSPAPRPSSPVPASPPQAAMPDPQAQMRAPMLGGPASAGPSQPIPDRAGANAARNARMGQRVNPAPETAGFRDDTQVRNVGRQPASRSKPGTMGLMGMNETLPGLYIGQGSGEGMVPRGQPQAPEQPRVLNPLYAQPPQEGPRMAGVEDAPIPQPQGSAQRTANRGGGRGTTGQMPFEVDVTRDPNASRRGGSQGGVKLRAGSAYGPGGSGAAQGRRGPQPTGETLGVGEAGGLAPAAPQGPGPKPQAPGNATPPPGSAQDTPRPGLEAGPVPAGRAAAARRGYATGGALFDPDGRGGFSMGVAPGATAGGPAMPQPTIGQPPAQQAPGQPIDGSGVDALAQEVQQNTPPSDPLGMGLSKDDYRTIYRFGLAMLQAGGRPGATLGGAIGEAGLTALDAKDQRAAARAEAAQADREMTLEEAKAEADVRIAEANRLIEMAKLRQDPIKSVETVEGGRLVGITERGNRIDLRMKSADSINDAVDSARRVATSEVSDGMGGTTTRFDPQVYNEMLKGMGYGEGLVPPIRPPLTTQDGQSVLDEAKLKTGQAYTLPGGRAFIWRGGGQAELIDGLNDEPQRKQIDGRSFVKIGDQWFEE